jgi:TM2 domain-containing membrane protein YozV
MGITLGQLIWGIVGGTIALAFIGSIIFAFAYPIYYRARYGRKAFRKEFSFLYN